MIKAGAGLLAATVSLAGPATAAFPGTNGPIVFSSLRNGNRDIYKTTDDPSAPEIQLTTALADDQYPAISPDSTKVAFTSFRTGGGGSGGPAQIWSMRIDGTLQTDLSNNSFNDTEPAWSPDGTKIAFTSSRDGHAQIYVMNADGSAQHRIFASPSNFADSQPAWSPDGARLAFVSVQGFKPQVIVMNSDGTTLVQVSDGRASDMKPNWSPDGSKLVFSSDQTGVSQIFTMPVGPASSRTQVTNDGNSNVEPAFSPDGQRIVYVSHPDATAVLTMDVPATGGTPTQLTEASSNDQPDWGPVIPVLGTPVLGGPASLLSMAGLVGVAGLLTRRRWGVRHGPPTD
jgi:TolB protein